MSEEKDKPILFDIIEAVDKGIDDFCKWLGGLFTPKQPEQEEEPPAPEEPRTPVEEKEPYPKGEEPSDYSGTTGGTFDGRKTPRDTR